jgi:hypothetical protein
VFGGGTIFGKAALMLNGLHDAIRLTAWSIYGMAGFIWLAALGFIGFRIYQVRTLTAVEAEVLRSGTDSYSETSRSTDSDGFTLESQSTNYASVAWVRYEFNGKTYTAEARHDTASGFKSLQESIARRWKPGARIRVYIDPAAPDKPVPDLGLNLPTLQMSITLLITGAFFAAAGYGVTRLGAFLTRLFEQLKNAHAG